jgi:two-component system NtrC family response regulator
MRIQAMPEFNLDQIIKNSTIEAIQNALAFTKGNKSKAASLLGITRPTLYDLMAKFGIDK